ncbi:1,4-alpha-glucan-branching enzyme [Ditylenchus destructor]|nr:1,4-alpha-glucan-branching enzyme [Ditylenchus destructor]
MALVNSIYNIAILSPSEIVPDDPDYLQRRVRCRSIDLIIGDHSDDKLVVFDRGGLIFIINFHSHKSFTDYKIGVPVPGTYKLALNSDAAVFGGHNRLDPNQTFMTFPEGWGGRPHHLCVYIPSRVAIVLENVQ